MNKTDLLIDYARAWSNLDISCLENILADDLEYNSSWLFDPICGKETYLAYLSDKFENIRRAPGSEPNVEMGYHIYDYSSKTEPCLVLTQRLGDHTNKLGIHIREVGGKINNIYMFTVPADRATLHLGLIPD